jgi:hypothetical protein
MYLCFTCIILGNILIETAIMLISLTIMMRGNVIKVILYILRQCSVVLSGVQCS